MKIQYQLFLIAVLFFISNSKVKTAEIQPRRAPNCAFLSNKIYCFGGYILGSSANGVFNSLDIYKNNNGPVQNLNSQWNTVTPNNPSNIIIGRREFPQAAVLPDGDSYFIQGGYNYISSVNPQQTIIYNAKTNTLQAGSNYNDANNGGDRQIYYGTGIYLPNLNAVGFYGGYQQHVTLGSDFVTREGTTISGLTFNNSDGYINSYAGFYYFTLYNINSNTFSIPTQFTVPKDYHISQSVFLHTKSNKLFYIGGSFFNTTAGSLYTSYMTYAMTYHTVSGQWLYESIGGSVPTMRRQHTTTILDNGDDVVLYGGTSTGTEAVMDYCYTLSIPLMTWTYRNLIAPVGSSGPRAIHSAVLVNKTSLFIMFGIDRSGNPTNDLLVLDVRNVNNITFATQFPFDNISPSSDSNNSKNSDINANNNSNNTTTTSKSNGIGTGAIAGIAVGCIAAGAIAVLATVCLLRRKKRNGSEEQFTNRISTNYEQQKINENDLMEVDWDKIDDQYREVTLPQQQVNQQYIASEQRQSINDYHPSSSIGPTGNSSTSSPSNDNASVGITGSNSLVSSPSDVNTAVIGTDTARPNTFSPVISAISHFKPDFSHHNSPAEGSMDASETGFSPTTTIAPDDAPTLVMRPVRPDIGDH